MGQSASDPIMLSGMTFALTVFCFDHLTLSIGLWILM